MNYLGISMSSCFHTKIVGMNSIVSERQFHIEIKAQVSQELIFL